MPIYDEIMQEVQRQVSAIDLVEMIYGLDEMGCINDGEAPIHELVAFMGALFEVDDDKERKRK